MIEYLALDDVLALTARAGFTIADYGLVESALARPQASVFGEDAKADIDAIRKELVARLGEARAERVANTNRNLVIFPNLVFNDNVGLTIRVIEPFHHLDEHMDRLLDDPGEAARLAQKCGRPVKIVMSREEVFRGTGPAAGGVIEVKLGAKKDGHDLFPDQP